LLSDADRRDEKGAAQGAAGIDRKVLKIARVNGVFVEMRAALFA
jgi:hypothetical protein